MKMDIPAERRARILHLLKEKGIVRVDELSQDLEVSVITVRRDLAAMESEGLLERTHGGAILSHIKVNEPSYLVKGQQNVSVKTDIARMTATLIESGETVYINSGSTTALVLRELVQIPRLTIVSNNVAALHNLEIASDCEFILTGGSLRAGTGCLVGEGALDRLSQSYPTTSIIGIDGISLRRGLTSHNPHEAAVSRKMIEQTAGRVIVVADSSKIGSLSLHHIAPISSVTFLITDSLPDPSMKEDFSAAGVQLIVLDDLM
ncbi:MULTISPECIES: DeoR/GlpR family DNA-binding transcription regulator [unclassified Oceanispirochaeta]|uniref:DeoR/GlpR family DNA-binding transcription regulator n=1 Tax=unclassified Oceanispirochaeta TaxID=2635722 RepID=UPI000E09BC4E|nr:MULTISPECIES: DeoR/GlpR family DNA-binding transcription regulator [unclassified Oceanispirochaeta]MBF9017854.1 DeoR/GlpR transcriptional regulator [Oceanispirochaeta sp. M2]NPD74365.1 DeoR/GlpR transcriptional regulator [Oceanispirochaeta sp. M1]RDG29752.1 DeoR/GlpR transcriptional regulator [Oceanispirochaeta sp. M1]